MDRSLDYLIIRIVAAETRRRLRLERLVRRMRWILLARCLDNMGVRRKLRRVTRRGNRMLWVLLALHLAQRTERREVTRH